MKLVPFSEFLHETNRLVPVLDTEEYACAGVRLGGRGAFIREYKPGIKILKKRVQHVLRAGDVVYSTLFAGKGAFAVADPSVDGAILSEKFPTYLVRRDDVLAEYMRWFFRAGILNEIAAKQMTGIAAFSLSHLSKKKFLSLGMPIPDLERQKEVVAICDSIEIARETSIAALQGSNRALLQLVSVCADELTSKCGREPMVNLGGYVTRNAVIEPTAKYKQVTVAMRNKGLRLRRICEGSEIGSPGQCYVRDGDLLFSRIDLRNGAIGFVSEDLNDAVVTRDFPVFELNERDEDTRRYLRYVFLTHDFKRQATEHSKGITGRKKLKRERFLEFEIPWPDAQKRGEIANILDAVQQECEDMSHRLDEQVALIERTADASVSELFRVDSGIV